MYRSLNRRWGVALLAILFLAVVGGRAQSPRTFVTMPSVLAWSGSTTYNVGDLVTASGSTYLSLVANNLNHTPASSPSQWSAIGASSGGGMTISGLAFTPTDTTIVAQWTTSSAADSNLFCAGVPAIDNGIQQGVTAHQAIVAGLVSTSSYSCYVVSAGTPSTPQSVETAAPLTRTPILSGSLGAITSTSYTGDTPSNFVAPDAEYIMLDDTTSPGASASMALLKITNESTLALAPVNNLTSYGVQGATSGTDGPGGTALSYKQSGLFGMGGCFYTFTNRDLYSSTSAPQSVWFGNVIADNCNHGATFANHQAPGTFSTTGSPDGQGISMFTDSSNESWCSFVRFGPDDGTLGYSTAGNGIDGGNAFVYGNCTDGNWNNSSKLWKIRTPRASLATLTAGNKWQWWCGPSSPTPADVVNPANWSYASGCRVSIYSAANQVSASQEDFVAGFNYYVLSTWYQPTTGTSNSTVVNMLSGPTVNGPWTLIYTGSFNPQGWYNLNFLHRSLETNTSASSLAATVLLVGDYRNGTYYHPSFATFTLSAAAQQTQGVLPTPTTDYGAGYVGVSNAPFTSNGHLTSFTIQENTAYTGTLDVGVCSAPSGGGPYSSTITNFVSVTLASTTSPQTFTAPTNFTSFSVTSGQYPCFFVPTGGNGPGKVGTGSIGFYYSGPFGSIPSGSQSYIFESAGNGGLDITETITIP